EQNSGPQSAGRAVYASLIAPRKEAGRILVSGQIDPTVTGAGQLLNDFLAAVSANVTPTPTIATTPRQPWLSSTINIPDTAVSLGVTGPPRSKTKGAVLRRRYTDAQIDKAYTHLTRADYTYPSSTFTLAGFGGQINALASTATATVHRDAVMLGSVFSTWDVPADDTKHLTWNREFYRDLHADTGGVPVPNDQTDGCYINWPDVDLTDPALNTSGVPYTTLYYKDNYARLQAVKRKYDPRTVFRHKLSVKP
ncbi:MAG: BBE domain-containing protein, partial [Solirubrobacterales bacterium]